MKPSGFHDAKPTVPPGRTTYATVLDWRQLQRWHVAEARIPADGVILFRPQSFLETYRRYVVGGAVVFTAQLALILGLLVQHARRRRAEEQTRTGELRYRSVVDTQNEMICRFLPDTTLTFVNDAYCRFWNKAPDQLLGVEWEPATVRDHAGPPMTRSEPCTSCWVRPRAVTCDGWTRTAHLPPLPCGRAAMACGSSTTRPTTVAAARCFAQSGSSPEARPASAAATPSLRNRSACAAVNGDGSGGRSGS